MGNTGTTTVFGKVTIIPHTHSLPQGWRILTLEEGEMLKHQLAPLLSEWSVVKFDKGKMDGWGYGGQIHDTCGSEAGEMFIIKD